MSDLIDFMFSYGFLMLMAQVACAIHAGRTGRPYFWLMLIIFLPMVGMLAYVAVELLPEFFRSRGARSAAAGVSRILDPEKDYRAALRQVEITNTIETRANLAGQCLRTSRNADALELYRSLLIGIHAEDSDLMLGLARAYFATGDYAGAQNTMDDLRAANPNYRSAEGHLLYARSLEQQGKRDAALAEYESLVGYYPGQEAKTRYANLLKEAGNIEDARRIFEEVRRAVELMPKHARRVQKEWYDLARRNLAV